MIMSRIGRASRRKSSRNNRNNRLSKGMRMMVYEIERCRWL